MKPAQPYPLTGDGDETRGLLVLVDEAEDAATDFEGRHGWLFEAHRDEDGLRGRLADARYRDWRRSRIEVVR
jgi:hypothetical protein